ncbi:NACHT domain-containing protein, partial [Nostoc linckia]|uniref:NACHT domain-containing protein n=1 Tax=Nostoc linckia TaxID=92942 RepID=UPI000C02B8B2
SWEKPKTCILGIQDYASTISNEARSLIQRSLGVFKNLLFVGCGDTFSDPNFTALISWLRREMYNAAPMHYALVHESEVHTRLAEPAWQGFVEPISYGSNYTDLAPYLESLFPAKKIIKNPQRSASKAKTVVNHDVLLQRYRDFLLRDCGQMTIEGMRADMDTAQRKFDLEKLFVPMHTSACAGDTPENAQPQDEKTLDFPLDTEEPIPFGETFSQYKKIALLALPGGGKTLLLKRLVVAYCDPKRRVNSDDNLPSIDLTPVLIRCREWREHIHRPIMSLLDHISEITGQPELQNLREALIPHFKNGKVLLLVDGLDEIHDDSKRTTFIENLENFLTQFPDIRLIVTSREAGFKLIAPNLARFCERRNISPLSAEAIEHLCLYWHQLMLGDSQESITDAKNVIAHIVGDASLRRLAENPLLLTMLLVVKHGAGKLPPDRVSLYRRAVDVLLDTWNIKGHEALNLKEAIPQLACVAFELMSAGKQTATENELLSLLNTARDKLDQIRRYAIDTPDKFLRRVELRSSLLVEAGTQMEHGRAVPFYQFRHLTFQEYLAAVAVVEGHYLHFTHTDTINTPLRDFLTSDEWKEVIPMAAVLARKQAEPLISALVQDANSARAAISPKDSKRNQRIPNSIYRLIQCFEEEVEPVPETVTAGLNALAYFADQVKIDHDWSVLAQGPFGKDLLHQFWQQYREMNWPREANFFSSYPAVALHRKPIEYWITPEGLQEIDELLQSDEEEKIVLG